MAKDQAYELDAFCKTIVATCYSPIAASAIHPCCVYVADGDKIVGNIDEDLHKLTEKDTKSLV